jgi:hypothetical protein
MIWHQRCLKQRSAGAATKISLEVSGSGVSVTADIISAGLRQR